MLDKLTRVVSKLAFTIDTHKSSIMIGMGCALSVAALIDSYDAVKETEEILYDYESELALIPEEVDKKEWKRLQYTNIAKAWIPVVSKEAAALYLIIAGHKIDVDRYWAMTAAYKALNDNYTAYRERLKVARDGDELRWRREDMALRNGVWNTEVEREMEDGTINQERVMIWDDRKRSPYSVFFDETSNYYNINWEPAEAKAWLMKMEDMANRKLKKKGYLFLSEVYNMLDLPITKISKEVGWMYGDTVSFDIYNNVNRRFVDNLEPVALLDFNVTGPLRNVV